MNDQKHIAILYSGGLDSYILYHMAKINNPDAKVTAWYYNHGQPVADREIENLPDFVQIRNVDWLNEEKIPIVQPGRREGAIMIPGRNLVFGVLLACQELPDEIWMGTLHGETHEKGTDKNYTFLKYLNDTVNYVLGPFKYFSPIKVKFPLADYHINKLGEVQWALRHDITKEQLIATRSCHDGSTNKCGKCIQCIKRWAVFGACGFTEDYDIHPLDSDFGKEFIYDLLNCAVGNDTYYGEETRAEMMPYILEYANSYPEKYEQRTLNLIKTYLNLSK